MMAEKDPYQRVVAVTGLGTINSAGNNVEEYWRAVVTGQREGIITNEREWLLAQTPEPYRKKLRSSLVARIKIEDLAGYLLALKVPAYEHYNEKYIERYLSDSAVVGAIAVAEAMQDADAHGVVDPKRLAFVFGTGVGGAIEISSFQSILEAGGSLPATGMPKTQPENAMIQMAIAYGAKGPSQTVTAACSSGNMAIINAAQKIRNNRADMIIAGGVESFNPLILALFERTGAADTGEDPATASRALHPEAGGAIVSYGGSVLVLEELEHARNRGTKILALVGGSGETNDAADATLMTGDGIEDAMNLALEEAGITKEDYISVNFHATATPKGDPAETSAVKKVFSGKKYDPEQIIRRAVALKSITGHGLGEANGAEAVASVKMLNEQKLPPSSWLADGVLEGMEDIITSTSQAESLPVTAVLSNGMGFGGQNTSVVFKKYVE